MPFMPRDPRQYRPGNPGQEWLNQLRSGGRITASLPLLDATGSFTDRLKAPNAPGWRERQAAGQRVRSASGTYADPQSRIPGAPTPGTIQSSARPSTTPAVASVISSLRPRGQGFMQEVAKGPPMPDDYIYGPTGRGPGTSQDRTDVGDGGGFLSGVGDYLGGPGMGQAMIGAGGAMMEAAGKSGASFGGSLGTGLKGFAAERARFQTSEAARQRTAQTATAGVRNWQEAIQRIGTQEGVDPVRLAEYVAMATSKDGYDYALSQIAPDAVDPVQGTAESRNILDMQTARATLQGLITDGVPEDDPRMEAAKQAVNDWELRLGIKRLPTEDPPTADIRNWERYVALKKEEDPDWVPTAGEYQAFQTETPSQYGPRIPGPGQLAAETRRIASYDEWFIDGRGAQFEKNLDTFNEVLFDLDGRIADGQFQGSSDWDNDDGSGFYQAMKGALVSRMPFMGSALTPDDTNTLDLVRAVVFQSLKETLGGQFAEREATALVQAAYNPMLPPEVNRRRIRRLMTELRSTDHYMKSMGKYYERTGELAFYTHQNAEEAWDLAVETGEVQGLGSSVIDPLEYGGLGQEDLAEAMEFDLGNLTPAQRTSLAYKLSGGTPFANLEQTLDPLAYQMYEAIRRMGR
jgi:hypothetical protein